MVATSDNAPDDDPVAVEDAGLLHPWLKINPNSNDAISRKKRSVLFAVGNDRIERLGIKGLTKKGAPERSQVKKASPDASDWLANFPNRRLE